jgi:hypothetical protein
MTAEIIFSFLLFLLSFLLPFALLKKLKIFPQSTNTIISVVIAFYFLSASIFYREDLMQILGYSVLFLLIAFILALIFLGLKKEKEEKKEKKV